MNTIISMLLLFTFNSLNKDTYYYIAQFILDHLNEIEKMSIGHLAIQCGTSVTTINKFCHLMGIRDYKSFKNLLINTRKGRMNQIHERYKNFDEKEMISQIKFLSGNHLNVEEFLENINKVVDDIHQAKCVHLFGAFFPLSLSLNFVEDMKIFNKSIYIHQTVFSKDECQYNKDDLMILITITGRILTQNGEYFSSIYSLPVKKVIITQNDVFKESYQFNNYIHLNASDDNEIENLIIIEILNLIKYKYYRKYINNNIYNL